MPGRPWVVTGLALLAWVFVLLAAYGASQLILEAAARW